LLHRTESILMRATGESLTSVKDREKYGVDADQTGFILFRVTWRGHRPPSGIRLVVGRTRGSL